MAETFDLFGYAVLFLAAVAAGAVNAIAGGGSLISFPALVGFGVPAKLANTTNNAALWPGSVAGLIGFWEEAKRAKKLVLFLAVPSFIGGLLGAFLLAQTPEALFRQLTPFLILFATLLFAARDFFTKFTRRGARNEDQITGAGGAVGFILQLVIATYGGFFGAGQSIMMMAAFSIMGVRDIHEINGLKTASAVIVNGVALAYFISQDLIIWRLAIWMGIGAIIGGYAAARISKRINQDVLRWVVIVIGLIVSAVLFIRG
ncbi:MAG: sulfite exporter TauE/SafE family protein [Anaerolineae bacterium]|nr:sulfite exporter TauE/SafE family protein [Anaerolineae bacterium]